uniref:Uncharacterized protein n=1 Tax=Anguilla anguilla TaxID=7936 RepID=A0A0E9TIQ2_ANGAN
MNLLAAKRF